MFSGNDEAAGPKDKPRALMPEAAWVPGGPEDAIADTYSYDEMKETSGAATRRRWGRGRGRGGGRGGSKDSSSIPR